LKTTFTSYLGRIDIVRGSPVSHDRTESDINILATLGRNLRAARLSAGLTRQEAAARVGIAPSFFAQIEYGCSDLDLKLLGALADAVGCDAPQLLTF